MNHPGMTKNSFRVWHQPSLVFFYEIHVQQVYEPPVTSKVNEHNIWFPIDEKGNVDVKNGLYWTKNQSKKATFKYEQEGRFCLGVSKIESKNGTITGKRYWFSNIQARMLWQLMRTRKKLSKNLQEFNSLLRHRRSGLIKNKYRQGMALQICR